MDEIRRVPLSEAMKVLGVSRSTIHRRLKDGSLSAQKIEGKWFVDIPITVSENSQQSVIDNLQTRVSQLEQERTLLQQQLKQMEDERDYLRAALAREQAVAASIQRLLPAQAESSQPHRQSWWSRLFRRDTKPSSEETTS